MNKSILVAVFAVGLNAMSVMGAQSILEIKNSITDDNIIAPESFETQTRLLEENFYLKNYVVPGIDLGASQTATPAEYEERPSAARWWLICLPSTVTTVRFSWKNC